MAQVAYIKASRTEAGASFGTSMALFEDTLVVGASHEDGAATGAGGDHAGDSKEDSGAVYVFRRAGSSWTQEARLEPPNLDAGEHFGGSVAVSGDTLAVGALSKNQSRGAVYVFRRTGSSWTQEAYLDASYHGRGGLFGMRVALSGDLLAVSAPMDASTAKGINGHQSGNDASWSGAVHVFRRTGSSWAPEAYIKASNAGARDKFGYGLALSGDTLVVGAHWESSAARGINGDQNNDDALGSGAVYVFRHTSASWVQEAYIKASNAGVRHFFGSKVALSGDTLAVGAHNERSNTRGASGAVYVFRRTGSSWTQEAYIKASNPDRGEYFFSLRALAGDRLAVAAWNDSSAATGVSIPASNLIRRRTGAVYMFRRAGSSWTETAYIEASNTAAGDLFGYEIDLSSGTLAVSAPSEDSAATGVNGDQNDDSATDSGAVYLFQ